MSFANLRFIVLSEPSYLNGLQRFRSGARRRKLFDL